MSRPGGGRGDRSVHVPVLARVEGEGGLDLAIRGGRIEELRLRIFEPPRFFEKFLEGRAWHEVPDIVARICGICPVAYQMSAAHAIEQAFGVDPGPWVRAMRRLLYCGEWLESHALHLHLLAAPDFFGCSTVMELAEKSPEAVRRGLRIQEAGNALVRLLGGRSVHPVGPRVGGFSRAPRAEEAAAVLRQIQAAIPEAETLIAWVATFDLPADEQAFVSVALHHPDEYPLNEGRLRSSIGHDLDSAEFQNHFREFHVPHSTALHAHLDGAPYLVGPLARLNLNLHQLPARVQAAVERSGIGFPSRNMFHSALARAAEILYALLEAERILQAYRSTDAPQVEVTPRAGVGYGCTEAPRGILWHRYELDDEGRVVSAIITPPTSQNQARVEADLRASLEAFGLDRTDDQLRLHAETVIRNYDPCISCSVHFLTLNVDRV